MVVPAGRGHGPRPAQTASPFPSRICISDSAHRGLSSLLLSGGPAIGRPPFPELPDCARAVWGGRCGLVFRRDWLPKESLLPSHEACPVSMWWTWGLTVQGAPPSQHQSPFPLPTPVVVSMVPASRCLSAFLPSRGCRGKHILPSPRPPPLVCVVKN